MPNKFNKPKQKTKNPLIWTKWFKCVCFEGNWNSLQGETYKSMFLENISWSFIHCCKHSQFPCRRKLSPYLVALTSVCNGWKWPWTNWLCGEDLLVVFVIKVFIPSVDCLHERLEYRATDKNHLSASKRRCLSALSKGFGKPWVTGWSDHLSRGEVWGRLRGVPPVDLGTVSRRASCSYCTSITVSHLNPHRSKFLFQNWTLCGKSCQHSDGKIMPDSPREALSGRPSWRQALRGPTLGPWAHMATGCRCATGLGRREHLSGC